MISVVIKHNKIHIFSKWSLSKFAKILSSFPLLAKGGKGGFDRQRNLKTISQACLIPLLVIAASVTGFGLLYSVNGTILVFSHVFAVILVFSNPFIGALLYLILLYARPVEIFGAAMQNIPLMKFLALGTLGIWLLHVLIHRQREFVKAPQNLLMIAFLMVLAASQRIYINGIINVFTGGFAKIVIVYFLLINLVNTEGRLYVTVWALILSTLWLSIHGILLSRGVVIGNVSMVEGGRIESSGIFGDPNDLAQAIVVALPFVFNLFFYGHSVPKKLILAAVGAIMLYAFLLTGSRGGFIGLAIVAFLLLRGKAGTIIGAVIAAIALIGLLALAPAYTVERVKSASPYSGTGAGRIELWYQGWLMFLSNPIIGVGKDNFIELSETHNVAHNSFVQVAAELGLPGLIVFIGLFYFSFKTLNETKKLYKAETGISRAHVLSDSLMYSIIGFSSTTFFLSRQYHYLPCILMALGVAVYQIANEEKGLKLGFSLGEFRNILLATFAFLVVWIGILKVFL